MVNTNTWLEVSLVVDGELAEAVAEVFSRFVSGGVVVESTAIENTTGEENDIGEIGRPAGTWRVSGYLAGDDQLETTRQRLEEALWYLGTIRPLPNPEFKQVQEADWAEAWKERFQPFPVGERLLVAPGWAEVDPAGRAVLRIDPGMAFGTGTHPTTQLCLELLEKFVDRGHLGPPCGPHTPGVALPKGDRTTNDEGIRLSSLDLRPWSVIDVGCGSGILAIAALKLDAAHVLAVDTDPEAVKATLQNASANGVSERMEIGLGSVVEILSGSYTIRQADLVVANIVGPVLVRLLGEGLGGLVARGGKLILSGILEEQSGEVERGIETAGMQLVGRRQREDWVALVCN